MFMDFIYEMSITTGTDISNLTPNTQYTFSVYAINKIGLGGTGGNNGANGGDASFYGCGGGGAGRGNPMSGGNGYQGVVIIAF